MQEKLIVETIGTFLLTSVILHSSVDNKIGYFGRSRCNDRRCTIYANKYNVKIYT